MRASLLRRDSLAVLVLGALTLIMTNPLVLHLSNAVEDKQDALLNTWIIAWVGHALIAQPLHLFDANIFYPYPNTLAFSEMLLPQGLVALPINLAAHNTVLGYNLVLLLSFLLAAYAMYLLVFDLTRHRGAAIAAGTIFAFNPYNLGNLAQVQLLSLGWLPLAMLFLRRMLNDRHPAGAIGRRQVRDASVFGLFFAIQSLASIYYAFLSAIAVALAVLWALATHWFANRRGGPRLTPYLFSVLRQMLIAGLIVTILVIPVLLPYLQVQGDLGFQRNLQENEQFSASLKLYAEVSPQNVLYGTWLAPRPPIMAGGYPLDNLFPGVAAVVLAVIGVAGSKSRDRWLYLLVLSGAFLLSLGPRLFVAPSVGTSIPLPYRWLYDAVPFTHALRAPVRFAALVMLALAVLAGMGMSRLKLRAWQAALVGSLIVLEYLAVPAANITPVPTGSAVPEYVAWLAKQTPGTVLELPMIGSEPAGPLDLTTQYLSTYHWQRTPDGYSGFNPKRRGEIAYDMQSFPAEPAIRLVEALDVRYLIVHGSRFPDWKNDRETRIPQSELQLVQNYGSDYVYLVTPRAQDASNLSAQGFYPSPAAPGESYDVYLIIQNRSPINSFAVKPTETMAVVARWSDGTVQQATAILPLVTRTVSVVPVRLRAPSRPGSYELDMDVSSRAVGNWHVTGSTRVEDIEPARQVVLPAQVDLARSFRPTYAPGESVAVDLTWYPLNKIDAYYSASVRVIDGKGNKVNNVDREPALQTMLWAPGVAVPDRFELELPPSLAPGEYSVQLLMYQANQGLEALLLDRDYVPRETATLGTFMVK